MKGKKSFLLYIDMIHVFEELTDEQAGKLIKHVFDYVNDKEPVLQDQLLKIAFAPIRNVLKKDLEEWIKICERNLENGKKGGRPKQEEPKEPKKPIGLIGNPKNPSKPDKDKDMDIDIIYNNKEFQADANKDLEGYQTYIHETLKGKQISIDTLLKNTGIYPEWKEELYMAFLKNAIEEVPQITDEKHAYNTFKLFVRNNAKNYNKPKSKIKDNWW
jgi:hypothetical protein